MLLGISFINMNITWYVHNSEPRVTLLKALMTEEIGRIFVLVYQEKINLITLWILAVKERLVKYQ
jgi:hypothetical protein